MPTKQQLITELQTDPKALGYSALVASGDRIALAAKLNATYAGVGTVYRNDVRGAEVLAALVWADLSTLVTDRLLALQLLIAPATPIDASQQRIRDQFAGIFAGKVATLANLDAVAKKANPSRAEELWGYGTFVSEQDIAGAIG